MPRPKTPDSIKIMKGTDQPVRMSGKNITDTSIEKIPFAPKWLSDSGKGFYKKLTKEFNAKKLLTNSNLDLVIMLANEMSVYVDLEKESKIYLKGDIIVLEHDDEGGEIVRDNMKTYYKFRKLSKDAYGNVVKLSSEFGLTPASISRIIGNIKDPEGPSVTDILNSLDG